MRCEGVMAPRTRTDLQFFEQCHRSREGQGSANSARAGHRAGPSVHPSWGEEHTRGVTAKAF